MRYRRTSIHPTTRVAFDSLVLVSVTFSALGACRPSAQSVADGDDPLAALRSSAQSTRYTSGYWKEQGRAAATGANAPAQERWTQALAYCGEAQPRPGLEADGAKPNCGAVRYALFELNNERAMREAKARVEADDARRRAATPAKNRAALDSMLFKP
jgi:hypothetical protein